MYSASNMIHIDALHGRFRGISYFRDFGRTMQFWTHFGAIFSSFGCAARTVGQAQNATI